MGNRSLDEFTDADEGADDTEADDSERPVDPEAVEPAVTTYASGPGRCEACGERADERWQGEAGLVCPDCKAW